MQQALFDFPTYDPASVIRFFSGASHYRDFCGVAAAGAPVGVSWPHLSEPVIREIVAYLDAGGRVFIDSGAFSHHNAVRKAETSGVAPPAPIDFDAVLAGYQALADRTSRPDRLTVQLPDRIGDQAETMALLEAHKGRIDALADRGVERLVAIQNGSQPLSAFYEAAVRLVGPVGAALPANASALPLFEVRTFLRDAQPDRVHFLGIMAREKVMEARLMAVADFVPEAGVSVDANRLAAWTGPGNRMADAQVGAGARLFEADCQKGRIAYDETEIVPAALDALAEGVAEGPWGPAADALRQELALHYDAETVDRALGEAVGADGPDIGDLVLDLDRWFDDHAVAAAFGGGLYVDLARATRGATGPIRQEAVRRLTEAELIRLDAVPPAPPALPAPLTETDPLWQAFQAAFPPDSLLIRADSDALAREAA